MPVRVGDSVNVVGGPVDVGGGRRHITFDSTSTALLVLHPDVLLSGECGSTAALFMAALLRFLGGRGGKKTTVVYRTT